jgi:hypothetical protein
MAEHVFNTPELAQCIKEDLLWQLQLAQDIRQDEVCLGACDLAGVSAHQQQAQQQPRGLSDRLTVCDVTYDRVRSMCAPLPCLVAG